MSLEIGCNIHNRFIIECRDSKTLKLKKKGFAENIMVDRIYTRICNYSTYFDYIHFGGGTGTLSTSRTTLFSPIGYKSAVNEEIIKAFPISKWTRKIQLNPEEYVGQTFTEVGISDSISAINTHALIKDSEGNPLSITKTDIDIIIIYATVFLELQNKSDKIMFSSMPDRNLLVNYLIGGGTAPTSNCIVGSDNTHPSIYASVMNQVFQKALTKVVDIANKKITFTVRLDIAEGNTFKNIQELILADIYRAVLPEPSIVTEREITNITVGVGDGLNKVFRIPYSNVSELSITVDDSPYLNFVYNKGKLPIEYIKLIDIVNGDIPVELFKPPFIGYSLASVYDKSIAIDIPIDMSFNGIQFQCGIEPKQSSIYGSIKFQGSIDKVTWIDLYNDTKSNLGYALRTSNVITDETIYRWLRVIYTGYSSSNNVWFSNIGIVVPSTSNTITLDVAPPLDANVKFSGKVPYLPKTEDYVLDVTFELQFGEGV